MHCSAVIKSTFLCALYYLAALEQKGSVSTKSIVVSESAICWIKKFFGNMINIAFEKMTNKKNMAFSIL